MRGERARTGGRRAVAATAAVAAVLVTAAGCADDGDTTSPADVGRPGDELGPVSLLPPETTPSTTTSTTVPPQEYEATTLDGGTVLIVEGEGPYSEFADGLPADMAALNDLAERDDCAGIAGATGLWDAIADDTPEGQRASAFAQHGLNLMALMGCAER